MDHEVRSRCLSSCVSWQNSVILVTRTLLFTLTCIAYCLYHTMYLGSDQDRYTESKAPIYFVLQRHFSTILLLSSTLLIAVSDSRSSSLRLDLRHDTCSPLLFIKVALQHPTNHFPRRVIIHLRPPLIPLLLLFVSQIQLNQPSHHRFIPPRFGIVPCTQAYPTDPISSFDH